MRPKSPLFSVFYSVQFDPFWRVILLNYISDDAALLSEMTPKQSKRGIILNYNGVGITGFSRFSRYFLSRGILLSLIRR